MSPVWFIAVVVLLACAPAAGARTIHQDLDDAHRYWGSSVCQGQWQVTPDTPDQRGVRGGVATGLGFVHNPVSGVFADGGTRWDWFIARCEFTVDPTLQGCQRYYVIAHEVGHFVHGPGHVGAMAPEQVGNIACPIKQRAERTVRVKRVRAKRSRTTRGKLTRTQKQRRTRR